MTSAQSIDWDAIATAVWDFPEPGLPTVRATRQPRKPRREVDERRESVNDTTAEQAGRR